VVLTERAAERMEQMLRRDAAESGHEEQLVYQRPAGDVWQLRVWRDLVIRVPVQPEPPTHAW